MSEKHPPSPDADPDGAVTPAGARVLEPDVRQMRARIDEVARRVVEHIATLAEQPSWGSDDALEVARAQCRFDPPETPTPLPEALDFLFSEAVPRSYNTAGPGYLAYIPGGGLFDAALASFIATATNRYVGVSAAAPVLAQLEANVIRWFARIVGYPREARGFLTSGGSLANFGAVVTARHERLGEKFLDGVLYASDQTHHSVRKAAMLAGFPEAHVRVLPTDARYRLLPEALGEAVRADRAAGLRPFLVVASAGTTNTGAIDPLEQIAGIAAREELWLHVDAAYGGFFLLTEPGRAAMRGIERADSLVLDPHKGLFLPYGSGCLLVRDGEALRRAHSLRAEYMPPMQEDPELVDLCEISPELSRPFRGLQAWLPIVLHGIGAFREYLLEKWQLARWAAGRLARIEGVEIVAEPQVTVVVWRLRADRLEQRERNALNRELLRRINERRRVYLTGTMLRGEFVIRICVLSFRTHRERLEMALEDIADSVRSLRAEHDL